MKKIQTGIILLLTIACCPSFTAAESVTRSMTFTLSCTVSAIPEIQVPLSQSGIKDERLQIVQNIDRGTRITEEQRFIPGMGKVILKSVVVL